MMQLADILPAEMAIWGIVGFGVLVVLIALWRGRNDGEPQPEARSEAAELVASVEQRLRDRDRNPPR